MSQLDSAELTKWMAFFDAKAERDEEAMDEARRQREFEHSITEGR